MAELFWTYHLLRRKSSILFIGVRISFPLIKKPLKKLLARVSLQAKRHSRFTTRAATKHPKASLLAVIALFLYRIGGTHRAEGVRTPHPSLCTTPMFFNLICASRHAGLRFA